ncbi:LysR family transcriptional regulator [Gordonia amarae]|uniref:LysR family transcriptional regulator n=2 Tax=Gordonia amarae TaxID=36821 RepID=A0A857KP71_9ACTN|nr:LysR substrate-binding domain-containing protein [Gordonia amarae]MCS3880851.1 DNA-binding transcriptional LysR family regulator [Gordonia amarae]QHN19113.1 LysR family transcriptional regulator [Gordonia amarae]QHN23589.1 LysR family transcriptional regulator [Gordonia amarae]QHN32500.1 LysR family transcriptional regulator [Gordonia amarae]QHN41248.1 LysR family transcriptional regulator [Gordonia amarae]
MELRHLRYFRAVAEELHFGHAAARLHIAQPPLSKQIRQLEDELGVALLTRSTRSVELTPAGADYLAHTVAILDAVDAAGLHAQRVADGSVGRLSIGCVGSATYSVLPAFARALRDRLPDLEVSIRGEMLAPDQFAALRTGDIDLALLRHSGDRPDVGFERLRTDRLMIALPDGHPAAATGAVDIATLRDEDFVAHAGGGRSVMNSVLATVCAAAGFTPRIRHEVIETSTLVTLVAAGLGVALVPEPTSAIGIAGITYHPLAAATPGVDLVAARRLGDPATPIIDRALTVLREVSVPGDPGT